MITAEDIKEGNALWVTLELENLDYKIASVSASIEGIRSRMVKEFTYTPEMVKKADRELCKRLNIPYYTGWSSSVPLTKEKAAESLRQYQRTLNECSQYLTGIVDRYEEGIDGTKN